MGDQFDMSGDYRGSQVYIKSTIYQHAPPQPVDDATLAAAQERLVALPLDRVPDPAPLPPGSRMPFSPNPLFMGRAEDLKTLAAALKGGETAVIGQVTVAAATGLGGIGKTQLASAFVHRYGQFFAGGVFWLSFTDSGAIPAEIANCGGAGMLDLRADFGSLPLANQVRLVLSAWRSPLPRLLVFDNCEEEQLLAQWRPPSGGARVLVTSRRGEWPTALGVRALALDVLPRDESVALLRKHRPDLNDEEADAIAEELGDLPLALHVAGSFLKTYRHARFGAPEAYLAQLRQTGLDHPSLAEEGETLTTAHERHVGRTFALSYARLDPQNPTDALAQALLARAACFAPGELIPRALLLATLEMPAPVTEAGAVETGDDFEAERRAEDALRRLVVLGLLEAGTEGRVMLHRLLTAFVRQVAVEDDARTAVEEALLVKANRLNNAGYPAPLLAWQPHLRAVTEAALAREGERAAGLCNTLGLHLHMIADYAAARPYLERALAIREKALGPKHPKTANSLNNLGYLLYTVDDLTGARPCLERALAIREKALGPNHSMTAFSLNNLGALLQTMGDLAGAQPYLERALAIREKVQGPEHPDTAQSLNNLGVLLQAMGDLAAARPYLERALAIREKALGPEHPDTAISLNNLGFLLQVMEDLAEARPYYERALAICEKALGPEHPHTAKSLNNLGTLLQDMGDLVGARRYYERALTISEKVLGLEHLDTATSLNNLGYLLQVKGDLAGARRYYERALAIKERVLGPEHFNTATILNNLAMLCYDEGKLEDAARFVRRALAIREATLGPEHPDTQSSRQNLEEIERRLQEST